MYSLSRKSDGMGDSGGMSMIFNVGDGKLVDVVHDSRPQVGFQIRVGSVYARSFTFQDWWQTSPVKEIISDEPGKVIFRTKSGSEYIWEDDTVKNNNKVENGENYIPGDGHPI